MVSCILRFYWNAVNSSTSIYRFKLLLCYSNSFLYFFACVAISVRSLSKTEPNYRIAFYFTVLCSILGLATIFTGDWILPTKIDFIIFMIMGLCGSIANLLLTQSYRLAEASFSNPNKIFKLGFCNSFWFFYLE